MTEVEKLIRMVEFFATDDKNRCWYTRKRWSLQEAKEVLAEQAEAAAAELRNARPEQ